MTKFLTLVFILFVAQAQGQTSDPNDKFGYGPQAAVIAPGMPVDPNCAYCLEAASDIPLNAVSNPRPKGSNPTESDDSNTTQ